MKSLGAVLTVTDEAYGVAWNGSTAAPTRNAVYDKIETITAGAVTFTVVEVNISAVAKRSGRFTITGSGLTIGKPLMIQQASGPYTGKGTRTDEAEMDSLEVRGKVISGTVIECFWSAERKARGNYKFNYQISA